MTRRRKGPLTEDQEEVQAWCIEKVFLERSLDGNGITLDPEGRFVIPERSNLKWWQAVRRDVMAGMEAEGLPALSVEAVDALTWEWAEILRATRA